MLLALSVIMTYIAKTIDYGSFYLIRFSLTPSLIVFTSLLLGPFYGALVGGVADVINAFLISTGAYNPLITGVYVVLGMLPWALEKGTRRFRSTLRQPYAFYGALGAILVILAIFFYATDWLDGAFGSAAFWAKPTLLAVIAFFDVGLSVALYHFNRHYEKQILDFNGIPSPNEVAFISLISETVVMNLLKALAFYLFFNFLSGTPFPLSFGFIFAMLFMASAPETLLMSFLVSYLLIFTQRYIPPLLEDTT